MPYFLIGLVIQCKLKSSLNYMIKINQINKINIINQINIITSLKRVLDFGKSCKSVSMLIELPLFRFQSKVLVIL